MTPPRNSWRDTRARSFSIDFFFSFDSRLSSTSDYYNHYYYYYYYYLKKIFLPAPPFRSPPIFISLSLFLLFWIGSVSNAMENSAGDDTSTGEFCYTGNKFPRLLFYNGGFRAARRRVHSFSSCSSLRPLFFFVFHPPPHRSSPPSPRPLFFFYRVFYGIKKLWICKNHDGDRGSIDPVIIGCIALPFDEMTEETLNTGCDVDHLRFVDGGRGAEGEERELSSQGNL